MSSTAIDFPSNRSQLDPSLNSPPYDDVPLLDGDIFVAAGSSYTWTLDTGETYGRWRNEDPGATGDGRYVKLEDAGKTQVINGGGVLSINDKITLNGGDGSVDMAAVNTSTYQTGVRAETNTGNTTLTVYGDSTNDFGAFVVYDGQAADKTKVRINNNGSAEFAGDVQLGGNAKAGESGIKLEVSGLVSAARAGTAADGAGLAVFGGYNGGSSTATSSIRNDGSASFAGDLNQGESWNRTANQRSVLITGGAVYAQRNSTDGSNPVFRGTLSTTDSSDAAITSQINADGSAKFEGLVEVGDNVAGNYGLQAYANSNISTTKAAVKARQFGDGRVWVGCNASDTRTSEIFVDGSAKFAKSIQAGGNAAAGAENGSIVTTSGYLASSDNTSAPVFRGYTTGNATPTSQINASGSATFRSTFKVFDQLDGRNVTAGLCRSNSGQSYGLTIAPADDENNFTAFIKADGSASFSGNVDVRNSGYFRVRRDIDDTSNSAQIAPDGTALFSNGNIQFQNTGGATFTGAVEANGGFTVNGVGVFSIFQALRTAVDSATNFDDLKAAMQQALSDFGGTPTPQPAPTPTPTPTPEPTPDPTNLIPDDWSHIEKLKALKELITEMDL